MRASVSTIADVLTRKKLLLLGLPVSFLAEKPDIISKFHRLLKFVVDRGCPVYHSQSEDGYNFFRVEGWMSLASYHIKPKNIGHLWMARGYRDSAPIVEFIVRRIHRSTCPVVLIRPGDPRIGDHPSLMLKKFFGKDAYLFAPQSAIDLVGDLVERILGVHYRQREYFSAQEIIERQKLSFGPGLVLIHSIAPDYLAGNIRGISLIANRFCRSGYRYRTVFLKSPATYGGFCTADELRRCCRQIDPHLHHTIALLPEH